MLPCFSLNHQLLGVGNFATGGEYFIGFGSDFNPQNFTVIDFENNLVDISTITIKRRKEKLIPSY